MGDDAAAQGHGRQTDRQGKPRFMNDWIEQKAARGGKQSDHDRCAKAMDKAEARHADSEPIQPLSSS
jgi:hypothetical protein